MAFVEEKPIKGSQAGLVKNLDEDDDYELKPFIKKEILEY
jgi:hypothetical protein